MTRHDSSPYRAPDAPKPPAVRRRWTLNEWGHSDGGAACFMVVLASVVCLAAAFVIFGPAPFVLRWAAVNVVAVALWCLAFVRREVTP